MAATATDPISAPRDDTRDDLLHQAHLSLRIVVNSWRRYEERRMVRAVQWIDHPGVLADMQAACGPFRG
jgi:hypothetical protein